MNLVNLIVWCADVFLINMLNRAEGYPLTHPQMQMAGVGLAFFFAAMGAFDA